VQQSNLLPPLLWWKIEHSQQDSHKFRFSSAELPGITVQKTIILAYYSIQQNRVPCPEVSYVFNLDTTERAFTLVV